MFSILPVTNFKLSVVFNRSEHKNQIGHKLLEKRKLLVTSVFLQYFRIIWQMVFVPFTITDAVLGCVDLDQIAQNISDLQKNFWHLWKLI